MHGLTVIKQGNGSYTGSRDAATLAGKSHRRLLRGIKKLCKTIGNANAGRYASGEFFAESSYINAKGGIRHYCLLLEPGCDIAGGRLPNQKGIMFKGNCSAPSDKAALPKIYSARQIARAIGVYSRAGKPHYQAVAYILRNIGIDGRHKASIPSRVGRHAFTATLYDSYAAMKAIKWFKDMAWPEYIKGDYGIFRAVYGKPEKTI